MEKKQKKMPIPIYILILMVILAGIIIFSFIAPLLFQLDLTAINLSERTLPPSIFGISDSGHLLGTDYLGRDIFTRIWYASRTSLSIMFSGLLSSMALGVLLGVLAGLAGGWVDDLIVFLINVRVSIPPIIIGLVVATVFQAGISTLIILITVIYWTGFARIIRAEIMRIRTENYIECSRAIGASSVRILFEHILHNIASPLIVTGTLNVSAIILFESSMSYLGLGVSAPDTSLGLMVSSGRNEIIGSPWLVFFPIVIIVLISMSISLIGDWLRNKLDPKLKNRS